MTKRYYENFPVVPPILISTISAFTGIGTIIGGWACREGSVILEVVLDEDLPLTGAQLEALVDVAEIESEDLQIEKGVEDGVLVISLLNTQYDFSYLFEEWDRARDDNADAVAYALNLQVAGREEVERLRRDEWFDGEE